MLVKLAGNHQGSIEPRRHTPGLSIFQVYAAESLTLHLPSYSDCRLSNDTRAPLFEKKGSLIGLSD